MKTVALKTDPAPISKLEAMIPEIQDLHKKIAGAKPSLDLMVEQRAQFSADIERLADESDPLDSAAINSILP